MNKYQVVLTRNVTESVMVEVEAVSLHKAETAAVDKAGRHGDNINGWELDEGNFSEVYPTGCDCKIN